MLRALRLVVAHDLLEYRYIDDVTGNFFLCFVQHGARVKIFVRLFMIKASEGLVKRLAGAIYKEENGETETKRALD